MSVTNTSNYEVLFDTRLVILNEYDVNVFIWNNKQNNSFQTKLMTHNGYSILET